MEAVAQPLLHPPITLTSSRVVFNLIYVDLYGSHNRLIFFPEWTGQSEATKNGTHTPKWSGIKCATLQSSLLFKDLGLVFG